MKHYKYINDDAISFIRNGISNCTEEADKNILENRENTDKQGNSSSCRLTYQERCNSILENNLQTIKDYDVCVSNDNWEKIKQGIPNVTISEENDKKDFKKLYRFRKKHIEDLCNRLRKENEGVWLCPICQVTPVNSFDHYIPVDKHPLYSIHPRNLIPCCTICNGRKSQNVFDLFGKRKYWNAYIDETNKRYLHCKITIENNIPACSFNTEQGDLSYNLYNIIKTTFDDLHVAETMQHGTSNIIYELRNTIGNSIIQGKYDTIEECIGCIRVFIESGFGDVNDPYIIARLALLDSEEFIQLVEKYIKETPK